MYLLWTVNTLNGSKKSLRDGRDEGGGILCPDELKCCLKEADRIPDIASSLETTARRGRGKGQVL